MHNTINNSRIIVIIWCRDELLWARVSWIWCVWLPTDQLIKMIDWDFFTVNNFSSNVFISLYFDGAKKGRNNLEDLKIKNGTLREGDTILIWVGGHKIRTKYICRETQLVFDMNSLCWNSNFYLTSLPLKLFIQWTIKLTSSMMTPDLGKVVIGWSLKEGRYLKISNPPLYHLTL